VNAFRTRRRARKGAPPATTATTEGGGPAHLSRRRFLAYSGAGAAGTILASGLRWSADPALAAPINRIEKLDTIILRRREDQLRVAIELWNLQLDDNDGVTTLRRWHTDRAAYLVYQFGPQHLADQAYFIAGGNLAGSAQPQPNSHPTPPSTTEPLAAAGQVGARLAGGTRLAFEVPPAALPLEFTTEQLLDWLPLHPRVTSRALPRDGAAGSLAPVAPTDTQTAVEYPWRLVLSPHAGSAWAHNAKAVDHGSGRYELWHTRLAVRNENVDGVVTIDEDDEVNRTVRAVWANDPDFGVNVRNPNPPNTLDKYAPFRMSLSPRDRLDLVRLSSDWSLQNRLGKDNQPFSPEVVEVDRLMLSSLGGWLSSSFVNELVNDTNGATYDTSLMQWNHIGAMGRDSYARVVRKGYLFPFGFKAALVTVTERVFERPPKLFPTQSPRPKGAYLRQRIFIVILKSNRRFGPSASILKHNPIPFGGRELPFRRLVCLTRITPDLEDPAALPRYVAGDPAPKKLFVPTVGPAPFRFRMRGFDWLGRPHTFDAPAVFVDDTRAYTDDGDGTIGVADYLAKYHESTPLNGARIALAEEGPRTGDTTFPVRELRFAAEAPRAGYDAGALARQGEPAFYPILERADLSLSDAAAVAGRDVGPVRVKPYVGYLTDGFGSDGPPGTPNRGDVFLELANGASAPLLGVSTRNAGGVAAPAMPVKSISRIVGPSGPAGGTGQNLLGDGGVADGAFDPSQVLDQSVKILGGIALVEVIEKVGDFVSEREKALKITSTRREQPNRVVTEVDWHPTLKPDPLTLFHPSGPDGGATCDIRAEIVANLDRPEDSSFRIDGEITNFTVSLFGANQDGGPSGSTFVRVPFRRLTFRAGTLVSETMEPVIGTVTFHGPLEFLSTLADYVALLPGAGNNLQSLAGGGQPATGPYLDVTESGVEAGIGLALPEIGVGVMTLSNLSLAAGLRLPFDGSRVTLTFSFASRENPFSLSVWGIGGGGFAAMTLSIAGVEGMEFSLEFGAAIGISIAGLASGKVELKAGINFKIETKTVDGNDVQECTLTAYVRLHGSVDILGLIEVSLTFYVGLSYITNTGSLAGEATLTIEIDLVVFSESVELTVRKEIAGPGSSSSLQGLAGEPLALEPPHVTWSDLMTQTDWQQYTNSFALVGAA
jgi:hypothetical protein